MGSFIILGVVGVLFITAGILQKKQQKEDVFFVIGGLFLLAYSIYLKDAVFAVLQVIVISASLWELLKLKKNG